MATVSEEFEERMIGFVEDFEALQNRYGIVLTVENGRLFLFDLEGNRVSVTRDHYEIAIVEEVA